MSSEQERSIQHIFLRRLVTTWATVSAVCLLVIVVVCMHIRSANEHDVALRHGRLVAAAIQPGPGGGFDRSVARIQSRYDELVAVGTVGVDGQLLDIHPGREAYRAAMQSAVDAMMPDPRASVEPPESYTTEVPSRSGREAVRVTAVMATVADDSAPSARRLVVLTVAPPGLRTVYFAIMLLWPIGVATLMMFASIYSWFDSALTGPLRRLVVALDEPANGAGHRKRRGVGGGRELVQIAERVDGLKRDIAETQSRHHRFEERARDRIEDRVARVDQKLRRAEDRAMTDPITGLRNRAYMEAHLESMFNRYRSDKQGLCAVMLDLDYFKQHNDRYGHQSGDELLMFAGSLLAGATRSEDIAIRYGGDEFLLLLPGLVPEHAVRVADRIVKMFGQHARRYRNEPGVSMSAGVASARRDAAGSGHDLVAKADRALYKAKHGGKNAVKTFSAA